MTPARTTDVPASIAKVRAALSVLLSEVGVAGLATRAATVSDPAGSETWEATGSEVLVDYGGHVFLVDAGLGEPALLVDLAQRLQDDVIDDSGAGWPTAPDGRGVLLAGLSETGEAVWWDGARPVRQIGGAGPS